MAEVWVRLPLGALNIRTWESLGFRVPREHEIVGSNPTVLTGASYTDNDLMRWVLCWYGKATVNRPDAGSIPASAALTERKGKPTGDGTPLEPGRAFSTGLEGSTPSPSASQHVPLAERQRFQASNLARRVRLPQGTLSGA